MISIRLFLALGFSAPGRHDLNFLTPYGMFGVGELHFVQGDTKCCGVSAWRDPSNIGKSLPGARAGLL